MIDSIFFHPLTWDNDMYTVYGAWVLIIFLSFWLVRFVHKSLRKKNLKYKGEEMTPVRDLFLQLNGFEYLVVVCLLFACYIGYWAYKVKPSSADWGLLDTYLVVLPQIVYIIAMCLVFFYRYKKLRNPYLK